MWWYVKMAPGFQARGLWAKVVSSDNFTKPPQSSTLKKNFLNLRSRFRRHQTWLVLTSGANYLLVKVVSLRNISLNNAHGSF
jgi:hypothetical protein